MANKTNNVNNNDALPFSKIGEGGGKKGTAIYKFSSQYIIGKLMKMFFLKLQIFN